MFNPNNEDDFRKLVADIEDSCEKDRKHQDQYVGRLKQYVGHNYGEGAAPDDVPVNMIELGVNIFQRGICGHDPQAMVGSDYDELLPDAACMELALNQQAARIRVKDSFNTACKGGLFGIGGMKVGITNEDTPPDGEGHLHDPGHVFADPVLREDWILDLKAKRREKMSYIGDWWTAPVEWVKDNQNYKDKARDAVVADEQQRREADSNMAGANGYDDKEFEPMTTLGQVFLTRQNLLVTFAKCSPRTPLMVQEWEGPEGGPYPWFGFGDVPGNIIPLSPVSIWEPLHDVTNTMFNKAWRQADRQKSFTAVPMQASADGNQVVDVNDGEVRSFNESDKIKEISMGGANQSTIGMMTLAKSLLTYMGGNWDALGGLSAMSRTVGQDELLASGASGRIQDMQATFLEFQAEVFRHMAFWMWSDPISEYHLLKQVEGTNYTIATRWLPEHRVGKFFEKNFKIDVFPNLNQTPQQKIQNLRQWIVEILMPAAPLMQPQGLDIDWEYIVKTMAKYMGMPEMRRSVLFLNGERMQQKEPQNVSHKSPFSQREYIRTNRSSKTRAGQDEAAINELFAGEGTTNSSASAAMFTGAA